MRWKQCTGSTHQNPPSARMGHLAVFVDATSTWGEELLLIHGGLSEEKYALGDLAVLQTGTETWFHPSTDGKAAPPARAFHCGAAIGPRIYVFGGHVWVKEKKGLEKFNDLWCLNTDNWEWSAVESQPEGPRPSRRDFASMVQLPGQRLLLHGGLDESEKRLDDAWVFDCTTRTWTELVTTGQKPKARYAHSLALVDQRVLLFGGEGNAGLLNDLWTLRGVVSSGEEPSWMPLELPGTPPSQRKAHAVAVMGWWMVVMGGRNAEVGWFRTKTDVFHNDVAVLDREQSVQWRAPTVAGDPPAPREFHSLTSLPDGRMLLFGGGNGKVIFGDAWWLDSEGEAFPGGSGKDAVPAEPSGPQASTDPSHLAAGREPSTAAVTSTALSSLSAEDPVDRLTLTSAELDMVAEEDTRVSDGNTERSTAGEVAGPQAWWSGSPGVDGFISLCMSLNVNLQNTSDIPPDPDEATAFHKLASEAWSSRQLSGSSIFNRTTGLTNAGDAARAQLRATSPGALRLHDLSALMWDYKQATQVSLAGDSTAENNLATILSEASSYGWGRFAHLRVADLRMSDVAELHRDYLRVTSSPRMAEGLE